MPKPPGTIRIARRFRGPPSSANGGYTCGRLAAFVDGPAEVTLRRPPPLERDLAVRAQDDGTVALLDGETLLATARPAQVDVSMPAAPGFEAAAEASARSFDPAKHKLPMCFVCGPERAPGDGMRVFCGPVAADDADWSGPVAAPWIPEDGMADETGLAAPEFVWAVLDCPTAFAAGSPEGFPTILLGRQAVSIARRPRIGEQCVVTARQVGREGRKYFCEATLSCADGEPLAVCKATWVEVERAVQLGGST